jgi:hypothetical protein
MVREICKELQRWRVKARLSSDLIFKLWVYRIYTYRECVLCTIDRQHFGRRLSAAAVQVLPLTEAPPEIMVALT